MKELTKQTVNRECQLVESKGGGGMEGGGGTRMRQGGGGRMGGGGRKVGSMVSRRMKGGRGFFFFQAEDGIRDKLVTGVQTCALPILLYYKCVF